MVSTEMLILNNLNFSMQQTLFKVIKTKGEGLFVGILPKGIFIIY